MKNDTINLSDQIIIALRRSNTPHRNCDCMAEEHVLCNCQPHRLSDSNYDLLVAVYLELKSLQIRAAVAPVAKNLADGEQLAEREQVAGAMSLADRQRELREAREGAWLRKRLERDELREARDHLYRSQSERGSPTNPIFVDPKDVGVQGLIDSFRSMTGIDSDIDDALPLPGAVCHEAHELLDKAVRRLDSIDDTILRHGRCIQLQESDRCDAESADLSGSLDDLEERIRTLESRDHDAVSHREDLEEGVRDLLRRQHFGGPYGYAERGSRQI